MADLAPWPDAEIVGRKAILDLAPAGTDIPSDPQGTYSWLPFNQIKRSGGMDDRITDTATLTVSSFAATKGDAAKLAEAVRQRLASTPLIINGVGIIDSTETMNAPVETSYGDTSKVIRYAATYRCKMRRY